MQRKQGHGDAAWIRLRLRAAEQFYTCRQRAGQGARRPMPMREFGEQLAAVLGVRPAYGSPELTAFETGKYDFPAVLLMAAEEVALLHERYPDRRELSVTG